MFFGVRYDVSLQYRLRYDNGCRWNDFAYINLVAGDWSVALDMTTREVTTHLMDYVQHYKRTYVAHEVIRDAVVYLVNSMSSLPLARGYRGKHKINLYNDVDVEFGDIVSATVNARDFTEKELLAAREAALDSIEAEEDRYDKLGWYKLAMP